MAVAKEPYPAPQTFLPPAIKSFLEGSEFGRIGLRAGRKIARGIQAIRVQRQIWIREFGFPLRNAFLLNRPITFSLDGNPIRLVPRGQIASFFWAGRVFEKQELALILSVLEPGMIFFDVGANVGLFTISAAKKIGGRGVFAFEPCSSTYEVLKQNLALNDIVDVKAVQIALGESIGTGMLKINGRGRDGLNTLGNATHPESRVIHREEVRIGTVDDFLKANNIPRVDVMKVDVEGAELLSLRGARNLLERADAPLILCEVGILARGFGHHPSETLRFLESCGYTLLLLNSETGAISEVPPEYQYDSMTIAVKPGHPAYNRLCGLAR